MKKSLISILAMLLMASCQKPELVSEYMSADEDLYAYIESLDATKTVMDGNNNVLWSEDDQLIAFMGTTLGIKYQIKEQYVGTSTGGFSKIDEQGNEDDLESGQEIDHNVVLYPHSTSVWCMKNDSNNPTQSYKLNVVFPETQVYEEDSFGIGSFPMIAVSIDNKLTFRNICGGLKLQFMGVEKIKSIKLEGIGNEKISGKATVVGYVDGSAPTITMAADDKSYSHVILDCGEGVQLSETTPTTFIIAVPPVEFASGMKIIVTDADGLSRTLTNLSANTIKRSCLTRFPVITYKQESVFEIPEGTLTSHEIPAEGGTVEIPLTTNQDYNVVIPEIADDWISLQRTKALRNEAIILSISENTTDKSRSAEVLITTLEGIVLQAITISQESGIVTPTFIDYVDEYGKNHGPGTLIDGVVWAPVNCGYHEIDYKYGKLYQWGRKYGQGYTGEIYDIDNSNEGSYSDKFVPDIVEGGVSAYIGNLADNSNKLYKGQSEIFGEDDWASPIDSDLWNSGTDDKPQKTEFDPCPKGWRVPTNLEYNSLIVMGNIPSYKVEVDGILGIWYRSLFFPVAGALDNAGGYRRGYIAYYWTSSAIGNKSYYRKIETSLNGALPSLGGATGARSSAFSIRCVQD